MVSFIPFDFLISSKIFCFNALNIRLFFVKKKNPKKHLKKHSKTLDEALQSVLGQQPRATVAHPSPFQAALQQHHQKQLPVQQQPQIQQQQPTDQAATFLGQILMQGILQMLQPKQQEKDQEKQQEKRVAPGLNMEQLLRLLSLPQ